MVRRQVLKMVYNGEWSVVFVYKEMGESPMNPYKIYYKSGSSKKKIAEYADFYSCLCYLKDKVEPGDLHSCIR